MIYAIQAGDDGPVKFGRANNPRSRLNELQTGNPQKLRLLVESDIPNEQEKWIHEWLSEYRLVGEWFKPHERVFDFVEVLIDANRIKEFGYEFDDPLLCPCCVFREKHYVAHGLWPE